MRRAVTLLAGATLSAALIGCSVTGQRKPDRGRPSTSTATPYTSPDGYSFTPPAGWKQSPVGDAPQESVLFLAPSIDPAAKFVDNIIVGIHPPEKDLQTTIADTKRGYRTLVPSYRVVIDEPANAKGQDAWLLGGTFDREQSMHLENLQLLFIANGKQYTVTFTCPAASFAGLEDLARASLLSVHLV